MRESADPFQDREWVALSVLTNVRGNRGELAGVPLSSSVERCRLLREVYLFGPEGPLAGGQPFAVEEVWEHRGRWIFKFQGIDSISAAEALKGAEVRIPMAERAPLAPGEYYQSDLMGCEVVEKTTGAGLGRVTGWQEQGGPLLLEVERPGRREPVLIPFARSICVEIDPERRRIVVELPEGLAELNEK